MLVCLLFCKSALQIEASTPLEVEMRRQHQIQEETAGRAVTELMRNDRLATSPQNPPMQLPSAPTGTTDSAKAVSAARLTHKVPKAAQKALKEGSKLVARKRYIEAAALFEKAIAIDPEYADAHNDLGAQHMALGQMFDATIDFRRAVQLDPAFAVARANLAGALYLMGDLVGAEQEARSALLSDPRNRASRKLLELLQRKRM